MSNNLIAQAGTMQTHGLPNDIMFNVNAISVMALLPLIQGIVYPFLAKHSIPFPPLYRVVLGLFFAAGAIAYTTGVQSLIYNSSPCGKFAANCEEETGLSIWLQTPTYVLLALAEILAIVSGSELAYTRAPVSMKSIVQAIFILFGAGGAVLGVASSPAAKDPNMMIVYGVISGVMAVTTGVFGVVVWPRAKREKVLIGRGVAGVELGVIVRGHVATSNQDGFEERAMVEEEVRAELGTVREKKEDGDRDKVSESNLAVGSK